MKIGDLETKVVKTWCPGCPNYGLLLAIKKALVNLVNEKKIKRENIVAVTGIGCHAKIYDYLNINGFYSLHGRVLPPALGIKIANPDLTVIGFGGDGDTFAEGISHFVHSCRFNADLTMIVHDNQIFALTTGQATPTTEQSFFGKSTPLGIQEKPLNPISLALIMGASFVARGLASEVDHLSNLFEKAIQHKGFAFVDVLEPCLAYHNTTDFLGKYVYKLKENGYPFKKALEKALEWDYNLRENSKIPIGLFYQEKRPILEDKRTIKKPFWSFKRKTDWQKIIAGFK